MAAPRPIADRADPVGRASRHAAGGFTLIEMLVAVAVLVILVTVAAPSFTQLIAQQRLKRINAELVTALQYARTEAVARNTSIQFMLMRSSAMTCYMVFIEGGVTDCDCTRTPGSACVLGLGAELQTTQIPIGTDVQVRRLSAGAAPLSFSSDGQMSGTPGASFTIRTSRISGAPGTLVTTVNPMGRPSVCTPDGSVSGVPTC
ncbi:MAG: GspH/FimT family pseudopilin [Burkholderiales bacterium]|nr:GspH/FimT family pseudopilin [Burkholderiales bacterium]MDE2276146.1 GspH/FimT family pseudopilin [Burkholderiales bacterium]